MNAIEIKGLCKNYPGFTLDNVDLTLPCGCIMGLVGENGAGKSTTIKLILDMIKSDSGSIAIFGQDNRKNRLIKEDIGVVLDEVGLPDCITAKKADKIMGRIYKNWNSEEYFEKLRRLSVPEDKQFKTFSRGTKMKLGIAIAMSHAPKLLILDEATSGLDPLIRDEVIAEFGEFTRDESHSVLISSHIVSDLEKICDYIAFMHKGRLMLLEEKDALLERYAMVLCSPEDIAGIPTSAIAGKKENRFGMEALVRKEFIPAGLKTAPVDIEELFIFMAKEAQ